MSALEFRPELGWPKDKAQTENWIIRRIKVEEDLKLCNDDPTLPIAFKVDLDWMADQLDTQLSFLPIRAKMYGPEAVTEAQGSLRLLRTIIDEVRTGVEPVFDPGGADVRSS